MWVEINISLHFWLRWMVILFVRMWVEISVLPATGGVYVVILFVRMWVEISYLKNIQMDLYVILFVRMWVEIFLLHWMERKKQSSSSWGCELKYTLSGWLCFIRSHPLREDVSWNKTHVSYRLWNVVILFVRMWVEMWYINGVGVKWERHPLREDVSWNI